MLLYALYSLYKAILLSSLVYLIYFLKSWFFLWISHTSCDPWFLLKLSLYSLSFLSGAWDFTKVFIVYKKLPKVKLILLWFIWKIWFQLTFWTSSRNNWLLGHNVTFSWSRFWKKIRQYRNCGKWSGILDEILPEIAVLTSGIDILRNILSIKVLLLSQALFGERIWCCSELEAR